MQLVFSPTLCPDLLLPDVIDLAKAAGGRYKVSPSPGTTPGSICCFSVNLSVPAPASMKRATSIAG